MAAEVAFDQADWTNNYQALLGDVTNLYRWNFGQPLGTPVAVSYRFADSYPAYRDDLPNPETAFRAFTPEYKAIAVDAMREVEKIINVRFVEDLDSAIEKVDLMISGTIYGGGAGNFPSPNWPFAGDITIGIGPADNSILMGSGYDVVGDKSYAGFRETFIHELGHSLGLWHPRNYVNSQGIMDPNSDGYTVAIDLAMENKLHTIMSYFNPPDGSADFQWMRTLMPLDIMALQHMYGVNQTATAGDDVYRYSALNPGVRTLWDIGGYDTVDLSNMPNAVEVDLRIGGISNIGQGLIMSEWGFGPNYGFDGKSNLVIGPDTIIEAVTGSSFADHLIGNATANQIVGGAGADTMEGLAGDDVYLVDDAGDRIVEGDGGGADEVIVTFATGSWQLEGGVRVETISAAPGDAPINISGNWFSQAINGNAGNNILSTGGGLADTLNGGLGDDTYRVFATGDVIEDSGGLDTVYASGTSYFLYSTAAVEFLSTSEQAGTEGFYMVGNGASQVIVGNFGNNTINGRGGDGLALPDTLIGLHGDDSYGVFSEGDVVREAVGQGNDIIFANSDYQLRDGTEIETLSAVDHSASGAAFAFTLRGNEFAQTIVGNNAANTLDGRGGNDTLIGFDGPDLFSFTTALNGTANVDRVVGFESGVDRIGLAADVFSAVTAEGISASEFAIGIAARDADDRLIYDQASGKLFFDADGNGNGAAVLFAQLEVGTGLSASDFVTVPPVPSIAAV